MEGHAASMRKIKTAYRTSIEKPEGKIKLGRSRRRWEYNIETDVKNGIRKCGLDSSCPEDVPSAGSYRLCACVCV
jgi:hypothetical protein